MLFVVASSKSCRFLQKIFFCFFLFVTFGAYTCMSFKTVFSNYMIISSKCSSMFHRVLFHGLFCSTKQCSKHRFSHCHFSRRVSTLYPSHSDALFRIYEHFWKSVSEGCYPCWESSLFWSAGGISFPTYLSWLSSPAHGRGPM